MTKNARGESVARDILYGQSSRINSTTAWESRRQGASWKGRNRQQPQRSFEGSGASSRRPVHVNTPYLQAMVTSAPSCASRTAVSFPSPVLPPVITAVCSATSLARPEKGFQTTVATQITHPLDRFQSPSTPQQGECQSRKERHWKDFCGRVLSVGWLSDNAEGSHLESSNQGSNCSERRKQNRLPRCCTKTEGIFGKHPAEGFTNKMRQKRSCRKEQAVPPLAYAKCVKIPLETETWGIFIFGLWTKPTCWTCAQNNAPASHR